MEKLKRIIEESENIVLFSGAGISCGSGILDFRSADGLYNKHFDIKYRPEEIISHNFLLSHPDEFFDFYKTHMLYPEAKPNKAHLFFAELEKKGKLKAVVTQNIDDLHDLAGNKRIYKLHGSINRNYCTHCGKIFDLGYVIGSYGVPKCDICGHMIRPDVVLYGENLNSEVWYGALEKIEEADCMIVVGTSLTIYPAANMVSVFHGNNLVLINKQATPYDAYANLVINDDIVKVTENIII